MSDDKITEQPLPDFIIDFMGDFIANYLGGFIGVDKAMKSQEILYYSFMAEQFSLMLQKEMISSFYSEQPEPLTVPLNPFAVKALNDTLHAFGKQYDVTPEILKLYHDFLNAYSEAFVQFLIDRKKQA